MNTYFGRGVVFLLVVLANVVFVDGTSRPADSTECAKGQKRKYGPTGQTCSCKGNVY